MNILYGLFIELAFIMPCFQSSLGDVFCIVRFSEI